jgi:hypothetical protein
MLFSSKHRNKNENNGVKSIVLLIVFFLLSSLVQDAISLLIAYLESYSNIDLPKLFFISPNKLIS